MCCFHWLQKLEGATTWNAEQQQDVLEKLRAALKEKDKTIEVRREEERGEQQRRAENGDRREGRSGTRE